MAPLKQFLSSDLGLPANSYIYKILPTAPRQDHLTYSRSDTLAVISSDESLRLLDPATLSVLPDGLIKSVNESVTCLERGEDPSGSLVATAGRDGFIRYWDKRSKNKALQIQSPHKLISSLVCNSPQNFLAAGIENPNDGPSESPVLIWDQRNPQNPLLTYTESHTDTITTLQLHPSHPTLLLSSSTDGLISIFDTSKPDEEDALYQVINHRSAVAHAGFMFPGTDIYAVGTDETMGFYALQSQAEEEEEPKPRLWGDVREGMGIEYVAGVYQVGSDVFVGAGKHSEQSFSLIPITEQSTAEPLPYSYTLQQSLTLPGAHGEEIVRDVFTDEHTHTTYTCGEDGFVRAWKVTGDSEIAMDVDEGAAADGKSSRKEKRREKKERRKEGGEKGRYKPY